jgi:hypothetical protein
VDLRVIGCKDMNWIQGQTFMNMMMKIQASKRKGISKLDEQQLTAEGTISTTERVSL